MWFLCKDVKPQQPSVVITSVGKRTFLFPQLWLVCAAVVFSGSAWISMDKKRQVLHHSHTVWDSVAERVLSSLSFAAPRFLGRYYYY